MIKRTPAHNLGTATIFYRIEKFTKNGRCPPEDMFILYDLVFLIIVIIFLPIYLFRRKFHHGFLMRLGKWPELNLDGPIWIHAVSVGEAMSIKTLVQELKEAYPHKELVVSTVTAGGNKVARNIVSGRDFVGYLPLDLSCIVKGVIDKVNPSLFILMETEFWPNLISYLYKKKIPILVINGRISNSSFKGYRSIKFLIRPILNKIRLFCVQTRGDAGKLASLGVPPDKIHVSGNIKFDVVGGYKDYPYSKERLGLKDRERLWIAASTHRPEEEIVLDAYQKLSAEFPDLRLLIAPRHPERASEVEKIIARHGFEPLKISKIGGSPEPQSPRAPVFLLDTVGQLISFYTIADIVFVGGSLTKIGGHNIIEPAARGLPVLFGPHMFNFRDIADLFIENKAAVLVNKREDLILSISSLLRDPEKIKEISWRAKELISQNQGATAKIMGLIGGPPINYGN